MYICISPKNVENLEKISLFYSVPSLYSPSLIHHPHLFLSNLKVHNYQISCTCSLYVNFSLDILPPSLIPQIQLGPKDGKDVLQYDLLRIFFLILDFLFGFDIDLIKLIDILASTKLICNVDIKKAKTALFYISHSQPYHIQIDIFTLN